MKIENIDCLSRIFFTISDLGDLKGDFYQQQRLQYSLKLCHSYFHNV